MAWLYEGALLASAGPVLPDWGRAAVALAGSVLVVELAYRVLRVVARHLGEGAGRRQLLALVLSRTKRSVEALAFSIAGTQSVRLAPSSARGGLDDLARVATILSITWIAIAATGIGNELATAHFDLTVADNRGARRAVTQLGLVRRVVIVGLVVIGSLIALTSLPQVRTVGASLLASAGVLGIVAGIAGQSTLGNVIAGLQVAFSDALRLDDVVVVQGEWGRIEQISLTYVVVKIWDERRLVLPVSYFITTPFENWTRSDANIIGTVYLYVDYLVPMEELRQELLRFVETHPLWDRRAAALSVVDATERTVQVRVIVSSANSGASWDLRCDIREHLIEYLRDRHPQSLPRVRLGMSPIAGARAAQAVE